MKTFAGMLLVTGLGLVSGGANGQGVLFDFENAQAGSSLPLNLTVGGITASFTSTGTGGYYIQQPQNTIGVLPAGFSGNALIPSAVYAADLHVGFSLTLSSFSILYAPQELACDSSATIRVTAYMNGALVGTTTTNAAVPGTWPSQTVSFSSAQGFNSVLVHYDAAPITGGDYGVIFVADNMNVVPAPVLPVLQIAWVTNHVQITWPTNATGFTLEGNTNLLTTNTWVSVTNQPVVTGTQNSVVLPAETPNRFYRLKQ